MKLKLGKIIYIINSDNNIFFNVISWDRFKRI